MEHLEKCTHCASAPLRALRESNSDEINNKEVIIRNKEVAFYSKHLLFCFKKTSLCFMANSFVNSWLPNKTLPKSPLGDLGGLKKTPPNLEASSL